MHLQAACILPYLSTKRFGDQEPIYVTCSAKQCHERKGCNDTGSKLSPELTLIQEDVLTGVEDDQCAPIVFWIATVRFGTEVAHGKFAAYVGHMHLELIASVGTFESAFVSCLC